MKKINFYLTAFIVFGMLMSSCSKEDRLGNDVDSEKATLSFGTLLNDLVSEDSGARQALADIPECSDGTPSYVEVALSQDGTWAVGSDTEPLRVNLNPNPADFDGDGVNNYFTQEAEELELTPGTYSLEYFTVYDANGNALWIAPRTTGSFAGLVNSPLPMTISLGAGVKKYVSVDVLCFDNRVVNEYGYVFFDIVTAELIEFCIVGNFCNESGRHFPAHFRVDAWRYSGDPSSPKGDVLETNSRNNAGVNSAGESFADPLCIALPDGEGLDQYYLEITLLSSNAYTTEERIVRSGVISDQNVRALFDGDSNNESFHFRVGCESGDTPPLFDTGNIVQVPQGYKVERLTYGLHLPTSATWDDEGNMFVVQAGGGLFPGQLAPMRIVQIMPDGSRVEAVNLDNRGIEPSIIGLVWHEGWFYFTHRAEDLTGAVSRVNKNGQLQLLFKGIIDNQDEHQINDIQVGPDGLMYVSVGMTGNAAVTGPDIAPAVKKSPNLRARPCEDIVLIGKNYESPNFLTEEEGDLVRSGAYVPFGVETQPGQVIQGVTLCGGSILKFDPNNAMATITTHAWGFRNLIGLTWDSNGNMYAAENGYDIRGLRPVKDYMDASLRIHEGKWYGVPDFSANREPLTDPKFEVADEFQAPIYINGEFIGKDLGFVIDHEASGLTPPDPSVVLGQHEFNSSPSMLDVGPANWGPWANHVFIAEWGDLAPATNPLRTAPAGVQIVRVDPATGQLSTFATNTGDGPASFLGMKGKGLERPFDVKFGPDGAMYIVDYGVVTIDLSKSPPVVYDENSGAIWKITKVD